MAGRKLPIEQQLCRNVTFSSCSGTRARRARRQLLGRCHESCRYGVLRTLASSSLFLASRPTPGRGFLLNQSHRSDPETATRPMLQLTADTRCRRRRGVGYERYAALAVRQVFH